MRQNHWADIPWICRSKPAPRRLATAVWSHLQVRGSWPPLRHCQLRQRAVGRHPWERETDRGFCFLKTWQESLTHRHPHTRHCMLQYVNRGVRETVAGRAVRENAHEISIRVHGRQKCRVSWGRISPPPLLHTPPSPAKISSDWPGRQTHVTHLHSVQGSLQ